MNSQYQSLASDETELEERELSVRPPQTISFSTSLAKTDWRLEASWTLTRGRVIAIVSSIFLFLLLLAMVLLRTRLLVNTGSCEVCGPSDDICQKWGSNALLRSRSYLGSGHVMKPLWEKIAEGKPIYIGVVGGSISYCADNIESDCYVSRIERQLTKEWRVNVTVMNGAVSAMGSDFFSACWASPFLYEPDLLVVELAVNDVGVGKDNYGMDMLLRAMLERPSKPAILLNDMWSPLQPFSNGAPSIETLAQFYDLPVVSHRNAIYHHRRLHDSAEEIARYFSTGTEGAYWPEGHHPSSLGHELTADLIVSFLRERRCKPVLNIKSTMGLDSPSTYSPYNPYQSMWEQPNPNHHAPPTCYGPQPGLHHFPVSTNPSPEAIANPFAMGNWKHKHYLVGHKAGDRAEFDLEVTAGFVGIMYWRSPSHGRTSLGLGRAWAWLEGEKDQRVLMSGDWGDPIGGNINNTPERANVRTERTGKLKLIVEIMEESANPDQHEFRISTIIA